MGLAWGKCPHCGKDHLINDEMKTTRCRENFKEFDIALAIENYNKSKNNTNPIHINAISNNCNSDFVITGGVLLKYKGPSTNVVIPNNVSIIGEASFKDCIGITSVVIPNGVSTICEEAFDNCYKLKNIVIPSSVKIIEYGAFSGCGQLQSIELPSTLEKIGNEAFCGCKSLKSISIPGSIKSFSGVLFDGCTSLKQVKFQKGIIHLGGYFHNDSDDYYATIISMFGKGSNVEKVLLPSTLKTIGSGLFQYCNKLKVVNIPKGVQTIGYRAFEGCAVAELRIPESVQKIESYAFCGCDKLNDLYLPRSVDIHPSAFIGCKGLTNAVVPPEKVDSCFEGTPISDRKNKKLCLVCSGRFKGVFSKTCSVCGREKNY